MNIGINKQEVMKMITLLRKRFKAGIYFIGDPCYAIHDSKWLSVLEGTDDFRNKEQSYKGSQILADGTAYGDGFFHDNYGRMYTVDSGLLGIIPIEVADGDNMKHGQIVTFKSNFKVTMINGYFAFGDIKINTAGDSPGWS